MSQLFARPGGGLVCSCVEWQASDDFAGTMRLDARVITADGGPGATIHIATFTGDRDPVVTEEEGQGGTAIAGLSPDGNTLYVAWGYRRTPVWHTGISVVDLVARRVVQTYELPDRPSTVGTVNHAFWLVALKVSPDGSHAILGTSLVPTTFAMPRSLLTLENGRITAVATLPDHNDAIGVPCSNGSTAEDWATNTTYFVVCSYPDTVRRFALDGSQLGQVELDPRSVSSEVSFGGTDLIDRGRGRLYHWNPASRTLTRVDLESGKVTGHVTAARTADDGNGPFDDLAGMGRRFGDWLAPVAAAKSFLDPSVAISPDGSRIYAIGTTAPARTDPGSTGVDVFDAEQMTQIDHWQPLADLVSVGASPDGQFVYVAGAPGALPDGSSADSLASVIVLDATSGQPRVICGALGSDLATIVR